MNQRNDNYHTYKSKLDRGLNEYSTHSEPHRPALRATRSIM